MQAELQTALFQAFDTLNLQRVKTFSVPPVTLCGLGALAPAVRKRKREA
jgi:alcohol dehydrogenase